MSNPNDSKTIDTKTMRSLLEAAYMINKPTPKFRVGDRVAIVDKDGRVLDIGTIDRVDDYDPYQQTHKYRVASERISNRKFWNESSLRKVGADYKEAVEPTDDRLAEEAVDEARDFADLNRIMDNLTPDQRLLQSNALTLLHGVTDEANKRAAAMQHLSRSAQSILTSVQSSPSHPLSDIEVEALYNLLQRAEELGVMKSKTADLFMGMVKGKIKPMRLR